MDWPVIPVTGFPVFDFFFSLVLAFGLIAIVPAAMFRLFRW